MTHEDVPVGSPLPAALEQIEAPAVAERRWRRTGGAEIGPFERAALETLGAVVVVPRGRRSRTQEERTA